MNFEKVEAGRLFGIPVVLDFTFILLVILYGLDYFTSGSIDRMSYGLVLVTGVAVSILLHEFGHAAAAHYYGVGTTHIELNGFGGLCYFARALPPGRWPNIVVLLAGPAVTLLLWQLCSGLTYVMADLPESAGPIGGLDQLTGLIGHLGFINYWLLLFNLLPSHPLDGGRALAQVLSRWLGYDRAMRVVAYMGLAVSLWVALLGLRVSGYTLLIAFSLFQSNMMVLSTHGGPRWRRWN